MTKDDSVNHPSHYTSGNIEAIDIIEQVVSLYGPVVGYSIGQVIKYISRAPLKGSYEEDLLKAQWYMNRAVTLSGSQKVRHGRKRSSMS